MGRDLDFDQAQALIAIVDACGLDSVLMTLSEMCGLKAKEALRGAYATRGKHRGQLLARCPRSNTLAAAAWPGAMLVCNPYLASIGAMLFMSAEQREVRDEVVAHFEGLPREYRIMAQRDREITGE